MSRDDKQPRKGPQPSLPARVETTLARPPGLEELAQEARETIQEGVPWNTSRTYRAQWEKFEEWCALHGLSPLPAEPETLVLFLTARSREVKVTTLNVALAAITARHRLSRVVDSNWSANDPPEVRALMRGLRRKKRESPVKKRALRLEDLARGLPEAEGKKNLRDRALLLVGFFLALRRSELVAMEVEHLEEAPGGIKVNIPRSKTDKDSEGQEVFLPRMEHDDVCPVAALKAWLEEAGITEGRVFPSHRSRDGHIPSRTVARVVKKAAKQAGFDPKLYGGHSLRSGFATNSAEEKALERDIMRVTRHRSERMVREYIQEAELGSTHPGRKIVESWARKKKEE